MSQNMIPVKQGLYDPQYEHDSCGVGFVVDLKGRKSHDLVQKGMQILLNLAHRGACGCEKNTGDGAGMLLQMPHRFLQQESAKLNIKLPDYGKYGVGMVFLPTDLADRCSASNFSRRWSEKKASRCWAGEQSPPMIPPWGRRLAESSRS